MLLGSSSATCPSPAHGARPRSFPKRRAFCPQSAWQRLFYLVSTTQPRQTAGTRQLFACIQAQLSSRGGEPFAVQPFAALQEGSNGCFLPGRGCHVDPQLGSCWKGPRITESTPLPWAGTPSSQSPVQHGRDHCQWRGIWTTGSSTAGPAAGHGEGAEPTPRWAALG